MNNSFSCKTFTLHHYHRHTAPDDRLASDRETDGYLNVHLHFGLKGLASLVGAAAAQSFDNAIMQRAHPHSASLASLFLLSPDMNTWAVCNDGSNLLGDTDERAAEGVIILWYHSQLIPYDVGHISTVLPHVSSF